MGDLQIFQDSVATENERWLKAMLADRRAEIADLGEMFRRLEQRVADLDAAQIQTGQEHDALSRKLFGDAEYERTLGNPATGGIIDELCSASIAQDTLLKQLADLLSGSLTVDVKFLRKLHEFFGPMLENKNPPLDGNQVATKDYVDNAVARIAGRIREQVAQAIEMTNQLVKHGGKLVLNGTLGEVAQAIMEAVRRDRARFHAEEEAAARGQASRLEALLYALRGKR